LVGEWSDIKDALKWPLRTGYFIEERERLEENRREQIWAGQGMVVSKEGWREAKGKQRVDENRVSKEFFVCKDT
jgi:hypothetical protein